MVKLTLLAVLVQAIGLAGFAWVADTPVSVVGKPAVIALTMLSMVSVLWMGISKVRDPRRLFVPAGLAAISWPLAFHLVGLLGFEGLLKDAAFDLGYLIALLRVTSVVFGLYWIGALLLWWISEFVKNRLARS